MNIKEIINNSEAEYFIPKIVNDFIRLADNGKLTKTSFIELVSKKYSYEKQILSYFAKCINKDINSLTEAINKLGIVECAFAIFNISLLEQLSKNDHESFSQMFEKGIFTAVSCYYLAKKANMRSPWKAYLSGLYSNISYFFLYKHFPDEFNDLMSNNSNSVSRMNFEWETFGVTHSDISWMIMDKAGIPDDIMEPVKVHHIKKAQTSFKKGDRKNFSPAIYLGSMLTTILYENHSLAVNFKLEIEKYFDLKIDDVDNLISNIVTDLKTKLDLLDINNTYFKGYFSLIYHSNNEMKNISLKLKEAKSELNKEKKQRLKFQKVLESYNKKLVGIAIKDPLTGIFNRRYLTERLNDEFIKATKYKSSFLIITGDIDHFKKINDTYGHGFGDEVLVKLVKVISKTIRKTDLLARIGGEEFVILCNQSNDYDGILIAEKVRSKIESTTFMYEKTTKVPVTMSFGVANYTKDIKSVQELMEISDNRLYLAKENGRNRVVYTDSTNEALM